MATLVKKFPRVSGAWHSVEIEEAAGQSWQIGDLVKVANGAATISAAAGSNADSDSIQMGLALQDATGVTGAKTWVLVPSDATARIHLPVKHSTPASAVTNINQVGDVYELENVSAAGGWGVDIEATSKPIVNIVGLDGEYAEGEQYGLLICKPIPGAWFSLK